MSPLANYDDLLAKIARCPAGDVLEIGALDGTGTAKLCATGRRVIVIDPFNPDADPAHAQQYRDHLGGRDQLLVFHMNTAHLPNPPDRIYVADSLNVWALDHETDLAFAFIDGAHDADHVRHDFDLAYAYLVPGGCIVFHDYRHDLPEVTQTVDAIIAEHPEMALELGPHDATAALWKPL